MLFDKDIGYKTLEGGADHVRLQLTRDNKPVFGPLPGDVLERAIRYENRLIVISSDYGFDGTDIHVLLLDETGALLDHAIVSDALSSRQGELSDVWIDSENRFSFVFFPDGRMEFTLASRPHWRIPNVFSGSLVYGEGFAWRGYFKCRSVGTD